MRRFSGFAFSALAAPVASSSMLTAARGKKYDPKVVDHYENPRNVGKMDKKDPTVGAATKGAPECGDVVSLYIKVDPESQTISDASFKAFGCGSAIASASYATTILKGKTLAQAQQLTNKDIASELSLPPVKLHCSMLAEETIRAAVSNYLDKSPELKTRKVQPKEAEEVVAP